jgi:MFS family permease
MRSREPRWRAGLAAQSVFAQSAWVSVKLMLGYRAVAEGHGAAFLALMTAMFAVPGLIAAVPSGRLADRIGGAATSALGGLLGAVGVLLTLLISGREGLLLGSAVIGLGNLLSMVGQQTLVAHVASADRDGAYGFLSATASAGQMIGPPLITTLASLFATTTSPNTTAGLLVCLVLTVAPLALSLRLRSAEVALAPAIPPGAARSSEGGGRVSWAVWRAMAISGIVLVSMDLLYTFLPIWALDRGVPASTVGILLAVRAGVSLVSRLGLTRLVRAVGRVALIGVTTGASAVAMAALPVVDVLGAFVVMVILGVGLGVPQPLTMAWAVSLTDASRHGRILGLRLGANRFAQIVVPLGITAVAPQGSAGVFWTSSGLLAGCAAMAVVDSVAETRAGPNPS